MFNVVTRLHINYILALTLSITLFSCSTSINKQYERDAINYYMPMAWIEYSHLSEAKYSGANLIAQAKRVDKGLIDVLAINGYPDYVKSVSKTKLNLAYLQQGVVLTFRLHSGVAPTVIKYQNFNNLSQELVKKFKRVDSKKWNSVRSFNKFIALDELINVCIKPSDTQHQHFSSNYTYVTSLIYEYSKKEKPDFSNEQIENVLAKRKLKVANYVSKLVTSDGCDGEKMHKLIAFLNVEDKFSAR